MSAGTVRGADAKEFLKVFNGICNWNGTWERWNDMVNLFAIEIANQVDLNHREKREQDYMRIRARYSPAEFNRFAELLCVLVECLEKNPFQDFLGWMYMQLDMGSKSHGQCFTPFAVCQAMANCAMPEEHVKRQLDERGWISVNDCACGAGATLIAAAERLYRMNVNYQQRAYFVAQDIDSTVSMMCYIQLSLIGCAGRVRIGDTLMDPDTGDILLGDGKSSTWYMPMFYSPVWSGRALARYMDLTMRRLSPKAEQKDEKAYPRAEKPSAFAPKPYQEPEVITASKIRRNMSEGQLMFDLTGGMI